MFSRIVHTVSFLAILAASLPVHAQVTPVEEAGKIDTPDFGPNYREIIWGPDNQRMILIPGGTYKIGRQPSPTVNVPLNQQPQATVTIGSFYIDATEVTNQQYNFLARQAGLGQPRSLTNESLREDLKPVVGISWFDATEYAKAVRKDLPTEAEWEIAARGKDSLLYPWGNTYSKTASHHDKSTVVGTVPVGTTLSDRSPFGVLDMAGNAAEWVKDYYIRDFYKFANGKQNPEYTALDEARSIRGGSFQSDPDEILSTYRTSVVPAYTREEVGFRTVFRLQKIQPTPTPPPPTPTPVPTPTSQERSDQMVRLLEQYFADGNSILPGEFVQFATATASAECFFFNQSPFSVNLGFVDTERQLVHRFPSTMEPYSFRVISIPTDRSLEIFSSAPGSTKKGIVRLGEVNALSSPMVVIPSYAYATQIRPDGGLKESEMSLFAEQVYGKNYQPDWHVVEVFNGTNHPVEIIIERVRPDRTVLETVKVVTDSKEVAVFDQFPGTDLVLSAKYLGASDPITSSKSAFRTNNTADRRFFSLFEDTLGKTYKVQLTVLPEIGIRKSEVTIPKDLRSKYVLE